MKDIKKIQEMGYMDYLNTLSKEQLIELLMDAKINEAILIDLYKLPYALEIKYGDNSIAYITEVKEYTEQDGSIMLKLPSVNNPIKALLMTKTDANKAAKIIERKVINGQKNYPEETTSDIKSVKAVKAHKIIFDLGKDQKANMLNKNNIN